jgi:ABC-type transport system involved in multi-copper enzyme maturation permease subunit
MIGAALAFAAVLVLISINLVPLGFVEDVEQIHLTGIYEIGFSLIAIFIFSQLFAEELEEGTSKWLFSLPVHRLRLWFERWLVGIIFLLGSFYGSLLVIHFTVFAIPWDVFTTAVLIPSLWLGHLALLSTLLFRNDKAGLAVPLVHWSIESISRGSITKQWNLFMTTIPMGEHLDANRMLYISLTIGLIVFSLILFKSGLKEGS